MGAGRPKSIDNSKVFDVAKPAKSKPMGTSRPVITGQGAAIKDSIIVEEPKNTEKPALLSPPSATRRVIKPISAEDEVKDSLAEKPSITIIKDSKPEEETPATAPVVEDAVKVAPLEEPEKTEVPTAEATSEEEIKTEDEPVNSTLEEESAKTKSTQEPEEIPKKGDDSAETEPASTEEKAPEGEKTEDSATSETASIDALAEASEKPKIDKQKSEEEAKKDAELQALIDSKKYFVPLAHESVGQKNAKAVWVALLVLVLIVVGAYLLVDAKVIKTSIELPYNFFRQ